MGTRRLFRGLASGCALAAALAATTPLRAKHEVQVGDWHARLSAADRGRLRTWRDNWMKALADARRRGAGDRIVAEGALLDPDAAIGSDSPPSGAYRCRTVKLGSQARDGSGLVAYPPVACRVDGSRFAMLAGPQRPGGDLHRDDAGRLVFVGAMALGDEQNAYRYGRDSERDMVGIVERLAPRRWRLVVPAPRWESMLDVIEIVPAR